MSGPGFFNLDASVFRDFNIREGWNLQLRAEAYGLTNSPVFANPGATASNATFSNGAITNYNGYDIHQLIDGRPAGPVCAEVVV